MNIKRVIPYVLAFGLVLVGDFLLFGGPPRPDLSFQASLRAAMAAQAQVTDDWLAMDGVVGTAVGFDAGGGAVVKVYLTAPGVAVLPRAVAGVPVQMEVTGPIVALADSPPGWAGPAIEDAADDEAVDPKRSFPRPVPIGVSTGHPDITAGTIGARVSDGQRVYALSNNHVFAANNRGRPGDNLLQPGTVDGGRDPADVLGTLHDFEPIEFCGRVICPKNAMDAAIALTSVDDLGFETPEGGYGSPRSGSVEPKLGMKVQKYGRTTGLTQGHISGINATIDVSYTAATARFENQIMITGASGKFSDGGDSGSLIVTKGLLLADRKPVGLLFAGSPTHTIANPIDVVLRRFGVQVDGG
ncbi:MAG TPA: hypothetical protein VGA70_06235 [Longimicrobiales bacterium]